MEVKFRNISAFKFCVSITFRVFELFGGPCGILTGCIPVLTGSAQISKFAYIEKDALTSWGYPSSTLHMNSRPQGRLD